MYQMASASVANAATGFPVASFTMNSSGARMLFGGADSSVICNRILSSKPLISLMSSGIAHPRSAQGRLLAALSMQQGLTPQRGCIEKSFGPHLASQPVAHAASQGDAALSCLRRLPRLVTRQLLFTPFIRWAVETQRL